MTWSSRARTTPTAHINPQSIWPQVADGLVFDRAGIAVAAGLMNAVILTSVLSAGNSGLYASTRMLYSLSRLGQAPRFFGKLSNHDVPMRALVATASIGMFGFLTSIVGDGAAYTFLLTLSALAGFLKPMLRLDPRKRASAAEMLKSAWLEGVRIPGEF